MSLALKQSIAVATLLAASTVTGTVALADHQGPGSVHVGAAVELGPRLNSRLQTSVPEKAQTRAEAQGSQVSEQAGPAEPAPKRKVRVVYPGPFSN